MHLSASVGSNHERFADLQHVACNPQQNNYLEQCNNECYNIVGFSQGESLCLL